MAEPTYFEDGEEDACIIFLVNLAAGAIASAGGIFSNETDPHRQVIIPQLNWNSQWSKLEPARHYHNDSLVLLLTIIGDRNCSRTKVDISANLSIPDVSLDVSLSIFTK